MFEQDALLHHAEEVTSLSRRQALVAIAALPYGALAAAKLAGTEVAPETFLPQATAAITSCWSIMQHRDFAAVKQALAHCLPALSTLAQKPSSYQQVAASLATQGNLLLGLVALHTQPAPQSFRQWLLFGKQAVEHTEPLDDPTLRILSLMYIGAGEGNLENIAAMVAAYEEAARLSDHELVSFTMRRKAAIGLAWAYARAGQAQQALQYHGKIKTELPSIAEEVPSYLQGDSGLLYEGLKETMMFERLGKLTGESLYYHQSWKAMEQTESQFPTLLVPERYRVEAINQKALVALRLGHLDEFFDLSLQGIQGSNALQSKKRRQEVIANWKEARTVWPREPRLIELADAFVE